MNSNQLQYPKGQAPAKVSAPKFYEKIITPFYFFDSNIISIAFEKR